MACSRSEQATVRFHLISSSSSLAPVDLLSAAMKQTSPSSLPPLLVTLDPNLSNDILGSGKVSISRELQVSKGTLSTSRGKRKMPKPEEPYPIREINILPDASATWLAVMDDWDVCSIESLPFFRRQVLASLFRNQRDVLFLDSCPPNESSGSSLKAQMLLWLSLLLFFRADLTTMGSQPIESFLKSVELNRSAHGFVIEVRQPLYSDEWAIGEERDIAHGSVLEGQIDAFLSAFSRLLSPFPPPSKALLFARRLAFCHAKDRRQARGMHRLTVGLGAELVKQANTSGGRRSKTWPSTEEGLQVFEFFSGIGGMRLALPDVVDGVPVRRIVAFDCSTIPNAVYKHNFHGDSPLDGVKASSLREGLVQGLYKKDADGEADIWTLSPPCQPYTTTRGALRRDHLDNRSRGLLHIMHLLLQMERLPRFIVLENVKGFVGSRVHGLWVQAMRLCGYSFEEFLLSPDSCVGLPNARSRYYFLGEHRDHLKEETIAEREMTEQERTDFGVVVQSLLTTMDQQADQNASASNELKEDAEENEEEEGENVQEGEGEECGGVQRALPGQRVFSSHEVRTIGELLSSSPASAFPMEDLPSLLLSESVLVQPWAQNLVSCSTAQDRLTFCFTKGYGKIIDRSAGSCYLPPLEGDKCVVSEINRDAGLLAHCGRLRLFHPQELLRFFGFPDAFSFPPGMTLRHRYNCIGNSINVFVVREVMRHLFEGRNGGNRRKRKSSVESNADEG
eukprot:scaffold14385_cov229-Ochromonas_danica.AAC.4